MNGAAIQLRGMDAFIEAYENSEIPAFAFLQGKDILFSYDGDDVNQGKEILSQWLTMIHKSHSGAVYALQLYKHPNGDITNKTAHNIRLQGKLMDDDELHELGPYRNMSKRLADLEDRIKGGGEEEEDEGKKIGGLQGMLYSMLGRPEVQNFLMEKVAGIVTGVVSSIFGRSSQPATVSGVPMEPTMEEQETRQQQAARAYNALPPVEKVNLDMAMLILMERDPEIGTHMLKLATILENDPDKYKMYARML